MLSIFAEYCCVVRVLTSAHYLCYSHNLLVPNFLFFMRRIFTDATYAMAAVQFLRCTTKIFYARHSRTLYSFTWAMNLLKTNIGSTRSLLNSFQVLLGPNDRRLYGCPLSVTPFLQWLRSFLPEDSFCHIASGFLNVPADVTSSIMLWYFLANLL